LNFAAEGTGFGGKESMSTRRILGGILFVMTLVIVGLALYAAETSTTWFHEPHTKISSMK
jgi:hypothetical protein